MYIEYSTITKFVWNQEHTWMKNLLKIVEWCEREILYAAFKYISLFELWFVKIYALVFIPTLKQLKSNSLLIFLDVIHKKLCFSLYFLLSLDYVIMIICIIVKYHPFLLLRSAKMRRTFYWIVILSFNRILKIELSIRSFCSCIFLLCSVMPDFPSIDSLFLQPFLFGGILFDLFCHLIIRFPHKLAILGKYGFWLILIDSLNWVKII